MTQEHLPTIEFYDPDRPWGVKKVEVVFRCRDYGRTIITEVGGNTNGLSVLEAAVANIFEDEEVITCDGFGEFQIGLFDAQGVERPFSDESGSGESWLESLVVSCRIVGFEARSVLDGDER